MITHRKIREFGTKHPRAREPLKAWYREAKAARWAGPEDLKERFAKASVLCGRRIVFDVGGNNYRIVAKVRWATNRSKGKLFVRFIGTHAEYDRIDASTV